MKWPGQSILEAVIRQQQDELLRHEAAYDRLLDKYHTLKNAAVSPIVSRETRQIPPPDACLQIAAIKAGNSSELLRHYVGFITEERAKGTKDEDIVQMIQVGQSDDPSLIGVGD